MTTVIDCASPLTPQSLKYLCVCGEDETCELCIEMKAHTDKYARAATTD